MKHPTERLGSKYKKNSKIGANKKENDDTKTNNNTCTYS
jgi:hypothetical protein